MRALLSFYTHSTKPAWLALFLLPPIAVWYQLGNYISGDVGWLLYATQRRLGGGALYRDIMETNPPLIVWLYSVPAKLAEWAGIYATTALVLCVTALLILCMKLAYDELRKNPLFSQAAANTVFLCIALPVFSCSSYAFGQREHLWVALVAPYLCQSLGLAREPDVSLRQITIALLAAVGFALKPFFVLVWAANEMFLAASKREWRWLFRRTNLMIGALGVSYVAFVFAKYPEYFTAILPWLAAGYAQYQAPLAVILKATAGLSAFYLIPALLARATPGLKPVTMQLVAVYLAAIAVHLIQQKGWYNHYYPMLFFGALLASVTLTRLLGPWIVTKQDPGRGPFALLCLTAIILVMAPVGEPIRTWHGRGTDATIESLKAEIESRARGKNVLALSFNLKATFPMMSYTDARYPSHFHHLWMVPGIAAWEAKYADEPLPPRLKEMKDYMLHTLGEELKKDLPALVWVDNNNGVDGVLRGFDFIRFFSQDPQFARLWSHYRQVAEIKESLPPGAPADAEDKLSSYTVYIRK